jgi:hypothetical protein
MKSIIHNPILPAILLLCAAISSSEAGATIRTVSNTGISIAQYNNFASAHTASAAGDTIYVHGSPTSYGSISITKNVKVIGPGAWPEGNS